MTTTTGGVRCHNPDACCAGQKPCPSPSACGVAAPAPPGPSAHWKFNGLYADTEVRSVADDRLLAVIHAGPERARIVSLLKAAPQPNAALADGWISVDERLPKCPSKPGSVGVEVLIHPPMSDGSITAFYGRRQSTKPAFYKYGALVHGVEFWMTPPAPPTLNASKEQQP